MVEDFKRTQLINAERFYLVRSIFLKNKGQHVPDHGRREAGRFRETGFGLLAFWGVGVKPALNGLVYAIQDVSGRSGGEVLDAVGEQGIQPCTQVGRGR